MGMKYRDIVRKRGSSVPGVSARAVLNILADYAKDDGICNPGYPTIARDTGLSERTVIRVIKKLKEAGEIEIVEPGNGRNKVTTFQILVGLKGDSVSPESVTACHPLEEKRVTTTRKKGDNVTVKGDNRDNLSIYKNLYEPEREPVAAAPHTPTPSAPMEVFGIDEQTQANANAVFGEVDFGMGPTEPEPQPPASHKAETLTPQQAMFGALCEAMGWDKKTLADSDHAEVGREARRLLEADYSAEDVGQFMMRIWFNDWRWTQKDSRPTLRQIRQEIGKIRAGVPVDMPAYTQSETDRQIDSAVARLKAQGIQYGQH